MKKSFSRKLSLNKNTVADLGNREMLDLRGGISGSRCDVETCPLFCGIPTNPLDCPSAPWTNCTLC